MRRAAIMSIVIMAVIACCLGCTPPMEDKVISIPDDGLQGALNAARQDGWEVQTRATVWNGVASHEMIMRRPIGADGSPHLSAFLKEQQAIELGKLVRMKQAIEMQALVVEQAREAAAARYFATTHGY
jgi:hypothetical protein